MKKFIVTLAAIAFTASMFANRYPWEEALQLFGAVKGYGAQAVVNTIR